MMRTRIKFCGFTRAEDIDAAVALGVDAVGFVFYPRSPRRVTTAEARALRWRLPSFVVAVGLFVDAGAEAIAQVHRDVGLDVLQLHGEETPADCADAVAAAQRMLAATPLRHWRAARIGQDFSLPAFARQYPEAEAFVLDSHTAGYGGSGQGFDWNAVPEGGIGRRLIVSGGLDASTVGAAIARLHPFAVDVSSGIQGANPRVKDAAKMSAFVDAVATADRLLPAS